MTHPILAISGLIDTDQPLCMPLAPNGYPARLAELAAQRGLAADGLSPPSDRRGTAAEPAAANALWVMETLAEHHPELTFAIFYQAPWIAFDQLAGRDPTRFLADPAGILTLWTDYHKEALRLQRLLGRRVLLLNAAHTDTGDGALQAYLRQQHDIVLPRDAGRVPGPAACDPQQAHALSALLAGMAPECCEIYDMLESCAVLLGREPEFHRTLEAPAGAILAATLARWMLPRRVEQLELFSAGLQAGLRDEQSAGRALQSQLSHSHGELNVANQEAQELRHHLRQAQDQLEAERAAAQATQEKLDTERQSLQRLVQQLEQARHASEQQRLLSDTLLLQLHQTQEQLESAYLESADMQALMTQAQAAFVRARSLLGPAGLPI